MTFNVKHQLLNENELLLRMAEGDEQAFAQLYSFYQPRLLRFVLAFALSRPFAEDLVQDILFKLWTRRETLVGILSLEKYLMRMARNQLLDNLKKQATEQKYLSRVTVEETISSHPNSDLLFREYHQMAWNAINQLPAKQKEIFLLRHLQDMTLDEIAGTLQSSRAAVQKNLTRAVRFIKDQLRHQAGWTFPLICLLIALPE
ncbi:RNA polymerase sigma factor [Pseudobacter ginsenosidimutans]|uniref:RNA polymerase sigma-70 factor (ECF subfamily) n=1 Tax=Pseudobacter ginsenosidimutans TaxID=661488 RepID=A0A4Q7N182_9BACT|nr:sigma-70 family RNA polymerase sigma factor [Pseudobacter ginsenosidimutans]QEC42974.1 sigma-70 family RNA polymerase sigma factor [Pseudobacter ginsenosidimutans]RZS74324.1 RNA polymerase sigma-70 factor (ECF subfamily) [Pseudobacter ginsenosidimutans]